ncbi:MAG: spermidine/putrescine ABC transporter substrate-binding protein [Actinomycetota bacterium]|nr:spermidine/putrescine ABC transporter substrate-binding protein [Actinomycetota bacterium]MDA2996439.1 spermidine/putrescine ABC transporter substrate-binding protein [Actinomycetota bacterium]
MKEKNILSAEAKSIINSKLTRRTLFAGVGGLSAATLLASCGADASKEVAGGIAEDVGGTVRWANWSAYLDAKRVNGSRTYPTLEAFISSSGIDVDYLVDVNDNDEFYGKVQGQLKLGKDIGYDIVTLTDWMTDRWIRLGYTQTLDEANMPNKGNILPSLSNVGFDPGRKQSLTWQSGFAGFGWNKELVPGGINSVEQLFDKKNKGRIEVLSEMRDTMGIILQYQGVDITKPFTEDQFMNAIDFLEKQISDGIIRQVKGNDYLEDMAIGDAIAVIGWSGDIFSLNAEEGDKFEFAIPESGGTLWSDNMMIASTSSNKSNSEKLMDYYYDPKVAAEVAAWVNYICPVVGAQAEMEKIDPELANSNFIFPDEATLSKVSVFRSLDFEEEVKFSEAFQMASGN